VQLIGLQISLSALLFISHPHQYCIQWRSQDLVVVGALERWGMGRGLPSPEGRDLGRGCAPSSENFWIFLFVNDVFWCIIGTILSTQWLYTHRPMYRQIRHAHTANGKIVLRRKQSWRTKTLQKFPSFGHCCHILHTAVHKKTAHLLYLIHSFIVSLTSEEFENEWSWMNVQAPRHWQHEWRQ